MSKATQIAWRIGLGRFQFILGNQGNIVIYGLGRFTYYTQQTRMLTQAALGLDVSQALDSSLDLNPEMSRVIFAICEGWECTVSPRHVHKCDAYNFRLHNFLPTALQLSR